MTQASEIATEVVQLRHHYKAKIEQVFAAWSDAEVVGQWFGPHSHQCVVEKYDFKQGGDYQIRMVPIEKDSDCGGDGTSDSVCAGHFVQIDVPNKIVMTFTWIENGGDIGDTLLTVEFKESDGGTDVILSHENLPSEEMRKAHSGGWQGTLECLEEYLAA